MEQASLFDRSFIGWESLSANTHVGEYLCKLAAAVCPTLMRKIMQLFQKGKPE